MRINVKDFLAIIALITITLPLLVGCSPSITREEAEKELVTFMLNSIIQKPDGESANYVQTSGQPWLNAPPSAVLIIYAPPNEKKDKDPWEQLKVDQPIKAWWYFDNNLVEAKDKQLAIQKWSEHYLFKPGSNSAATSWPDSYEFGILSMSRNNKKATVYSSSSSCPECAGGVILTLERNASGKWEIIDSELLWLS